MRPVAVDSLTTLLSAILLVATSPATPLGARPARARRAGGDAHAQGLLPLAVEVRGGFAVPQGDWKDDFGVDGGFGYGINARLQLMPLISFYGGWETYSFDMDAEDSETTDAGLRAGAQLSLPLAALTGLSPYAFAGVIYNRTKMEFGEGVSVEFESDDGFGWEAGGGVSVPFAPTLSFRPGSTRFSSGMPKPAVLPVPVGA